MINDSTKDQSNSDSNNSSVVNTNNKFVNKGKLNKNNDNVNDKSKDKTNDKQNDNNTKKPEIKAQKFIKKSSFVNNNSLNSIKDSNSKSNTDENL
jgi:hypothetical protein